MMQSETHFKKIVMRDLTDDYGENIKILKTQERGRVGVLDLILCLYGDHIEIELKVDGAKATALQQVNIDKVLLAGGYAFVTSPSQWDSHRDIIRSKYGSRPKQG